MAYEPRAPPAEATVIPQQLNRQLNPQLNPQLNIVSADEPAQWREALEGIGHDFYHEAAYHRFCQERGDGEGYLAVYREAESVLLWPYLLRPIEGSAEYSDVTSVYGYPGPLASGASGPFVERGLAALKDHWRSRNAVTAFTRLHPILGNQFLLEDIEPAQLGGATIAVDLRLPPEEIWRRYRKDIRHDIRHAHRHGLTVEPDPDLLRLPRFVELYRETMIRNHAEQSYFFDCSYFRRLFESFPLRAHLFTVCDGETVAAGGIFIETGRIVQYHLAASAGAHLLLRLQLLPTALRVVPLAPGGSSCCWTRCGAGRPGADMSTFTSAADEEGSAIACSTSRRRSRG